MDKYFMQTKFYDRTNVKFEISTIETYSRFLKINGVNKLTLFSEEKFINDSLILEEVFITINQKEFSFSFNKNSFFKIDHEYRIVENGEEILSFQIIKEDSRFNIYFTPKAYGNFTFDFISLKVKSLNKNLSVSLPISLDFELLPIDVMDVNLVNKAYKKTGLASSLNSIEKDDSIESDISFRYKGLELTKDIEFSYIKFINNDTLLEEQVKVENSIYSKHSKYCSFSFKKEKDSSSFVFYDFISRNDFTVRLGLKQNSIIKEIELVNIKIARVPLVSKIRVTDFKILENNFATIVLGTPLEIKVDITGGYGNRNLSWKIDSKEVTKNTEKLVVKYLPKYNSVISFTCFDTLSSSTDTKIIYSAKESKFNISLNKFIYTEEDEIVLDINKLNFQEFHLFDNSLYKFMDIKAKIDDQDFIDERIQDIDFTKKIPYSIFTKGVHTLSVKVSDLFGTYNEIITFEIK